MRGATKRLFCRTRLMIGASEREPLWLAGAFVGFTFECWFLWIFFRQKPRHDVSSQRILGCAASKPDV